MSCSINIDFQGQSIWKASLAILNHTLNFTLNRHPSRHQDATSNCESYENTQNSIFSHPICLHSLLLAHPRAWVFWYSPVNHCSIWRCPSPCILQLTGIPSSHFEKIFSFGSPILTWVIIFVIIKQTLSLAGSQTRIQDGVSSKYRKSQHSRVILSQLSTQTPDNLSESTVLP